MPKQIFQRPAHINTKKSGKFSGAPGQPDWSPGNKKPKKVKAGKSTAAKTTTPSDLPDPKKG